MYATNNRKSVNILNLFMVLLLCNSVYSLTDEEAKQQFLKYLLKCTKDNPVDMADLLPLQKFVVPTKHEVKCLLGCAYKTVGTLDKDGHYNLAKAYEIAKTMREGDDKREENAKKLADICSKVNEITDDAKACERATKLFQCVTENAPKSMTDEEAKQRFLKFALKCTKDHPVEMADLLALQKLIVPTKREVKCLLACTYKGIGTLDKSGHFNVTNGYEVAKMMREGDDKREENGRKLTDICAKVDDMANEECELSGKIFECLVNNAPKLGFKIA